MLTRMRIDKSAGLWYILYNSGRGNACRISVRKGGSKDESMSSQ